MLTLTLAYQCRLCGRTMPGIIPHRCAGGFRKRGLSYTLVSLPYWGA